MVDNVKWLEGKIKEASEAGNYQDWENYTAMLKQEQSKESNNE